MSGSPNAPAGKEHPDNEPTVLPADLQNLRDTLANPKASHMQRCDAIMAVVYEDMKDHSDF